MTSARECLRRDLEACRQLGFAGSLVVVALPEGVAPSVLRRVVDGLRGALRNTDVVARLSPTELAVLVWGTGRDGAARVGGKLESELAAALGWETAWGIGWLDLAELPAGRPGSADGGEGDEIEAAIRQARGLVGRQAVTG